MPRRTVWLAAGALVGAAPRRIRGVMAGVLVALALVRMRGGADAPDCTMADASTGTIMEPTAKTTTANHLRAAEI